MPQNDNTSTYRLLGLGMELTAAVLGLALFGWWVGGKLGSAKLGLLFGATVGLIGGMYNLIKSALSVSSSGSSSERASEEEGVPGDEAAGTPGDGTAASRVLHGSTRLPPDDES